MKNLLQREGPFVPSTYEKHPGLFDSNIAVNFFFVCAVLKIIINNGNVVYAKRNPLNASFDFFFSNVGSMLNSETKTSFSVWRKEVVQTKPLSDVRPDVFIQLHEFLEERNEL